MKRRIFTSLLNPLARMPALEGLAGALPREVSQDKWINLASQ
jgi:hypothetical protein